MGSNPSSGAIKNSMGVGFRYTFWNEKVGMMKISLYIPKESGCQRTFVKQELVQSQNIKSKSTRKSVMAGLKKILSVLPDRHMEGMAVFTDGT